jgi:hypothetical protein
MELPFTFGSTARWSLRSRKVPGWISGLKNPRVGGSIPPLTTTLDNVLNQIAPTAREIAAAADRETVPGEAPVMGRLTLSGGPVSEALDACEAAAGELAVFLLQLDSNIAAP